MGYERIVSDEINAELDRLEKTGQKWVADWIAQAIIKRHESSLDKANEDSEFWRYCGYANIRDAVRRKINARAGDRADKGDDRQGTLLGYNHVQSFYVVERAGVGEVGVPVYDLKDAEIDAKIALYERMGAACLEHADELRLFKDQRKGRRRPKGPSND